MKRINIYLEEEVYETLRKEAFDRKVSMSSIVNSRIGNPVYVLTPNSVDAIVTEPGQIIPITPETQFKQLPENPKPKKKEKIVSKPITRSFEGTPRGTLDVENYV